MYEKLIAEGREPWVVIPVLGNCKPAIIDRLADALASTCREVAGLHNLNQIAQGNYESYIAEQMKLTKELALLNLELAKHLCASRAEVVSLQARMPPAAPEETGFC